MARSKEHKESLVVTPRKSGLSRHLQKFETSVEGTVGGRFRRMNIESKGASERWSGSRQNVRPMYDTKKRMFLLVKKDGTPYTAAEMEKFPERFPTLVDEIPGSTTFGMDIEKCNPYNRGDRYLNHPEFVMMKEEGEVVVSETDPFFEIKAAAIRGHKEYQLVSASGHYPQGIRAVISDPEREAEAKRRERKGKMDAYTLLQNMSSKKRISVLRALGQQVDRNTHPDIIEEALFAYVDDPDTTEHGMTKQALFVKYAKMDEQELHLKALVIYAYNSQIIRLDKGVYRFENENLGMSFPEIEVFLKRPENYQTLEALQMQVDRDQAAQEATAFGQEPLDEEE